MFNTLRRKFIAVTMCSVFVVLTLLIGIINVVNYANVVKNADELVLILKEGQGAFVGKEPPFGEGPEDGKNKRPPSPETPYETRFFTVVFTDEGEIDRVDTTQITAVNEELAVKYAQNLYQNNQTKGFLYIYRYGTTTMETGGTMYIFVDCSKTLKGFRSFLLTSIAVGFAGFAMIFLLVFLFSGKVMKPVAESYYKQKRFITDAGHEIKTPLTVIGANVAVLEMQGFGNEWTESIKNEVKRLTSLTEKLVFLARMDEERQALNATDFSISDAAEETIAPFEAVALSRGLTLKRDIRKNLTYCGDESMIRQMMSQLLDNALKYCDEGGNVSVALFPAANKIRLSVRNTAKDFPDGEPEILFERFYRTDKSRNSRTGGHGVGLSVVKAIVTAHKGKITVRCENGEITFSVLL